VAFNQKAVHVGGRRQPHLKISVTCSPPQTTDTAVQATSTVMDCSGNRQDERNVKHKLG